MLEDWRVRLFLAGGERHRAISWIAGVRKQLLNVPALAFKDTRIAPSTLVKLRQARLPLVGWTRKQSHKTRRDSK